METLWAGLSRLAQAAFTVWLAATLTFFVLKLVPGDPVEARLGPLAGISSEQKAAIRTELGLDLPIWQQYLSMLASTLQFDFGVSYQQKLPVTAVLSQQILPTVQLGMLSLVFMTMLVVIGGIIRRGGAKWNGGGIRQAVIETAQLVSVSVPTYWIGYTLLIVFSFWLGWLPSGPNQGLMSLILPSLALAIPLAGLVSRVLDSELDSAEQALFAVSSRARGMGRGKFAWRHGIRHAVPPIACLLTTLIGGILGGAVLIENVFARPGLGRVALAAITSRDMPVIIGLVILSALVFSVLGLLADLLVWWADPRKESRRV